MQGAVVGGTGLHTGLPATVRLYRRDGALRLRASAIEVRVEELNVVCTLRATSVEAKDGSLRVGTVEHLFGALGGLGVREGMTIEVDGPEMPVLDGAAAAWCDAIEPLQLRAAPPRARVSRAAVFHVGESRYEFVPGDCIEVGVRIDFGDCRIAAEAEWAGSPEDFRSRIAPARTFARTRDLDEFFREGLARRIDPSSVVVIDDGAIHCAGRPFMPDEPARHKLLDLVGDAYLHGGPPLGRICAFRPGHTASARVFREALAQGVLVRV
jgi:UDP-3-O-[3-hydroxymyristoyl] N-acetylglucosamine deacetylase